MPSTINDTDQQQSSNLTLPHSVMAVVSPHPYLLAHLQPSDPSVAAVRPNGRAVSAFRRPNCHTGSLTHCAGSAVVRVGDTAVVCGIHAEILLASSIPNPPAPSQSHSDDELMAQLQLLVPNVELATGCSPSNLPGAGGPPSSMAQTLAHRLHSLLHAAQVVNLEDLRIRKPQSEGALGTAESEAADPEVVAYWTLYASIYVLSLSGNMSLFDVAWAALMGALGNCRLPHAWWDLDAENIVCSSDLARSRRLRLQSRPISCTWGVLIGSKKQETKPQSLQNMTSLINGEPRDVDDVRQAWLLADPDGFEDSLCHESVTIVIDCSVGLEKAKIIAVEKHGGEVITFSDIFELRKSAMQRWKDWTGVLFPV